MTTPWRVDHVPNGAMRNADTTWWPDEDSALAEASRLRFSGCQRVVAWRWETHTGPEAARTAPVASDGPSTGNAEREGDQ